jgi:hypothetical protein
MTQTMAVNNAMETHPLNAKCECACNRFFWCTAGRGRIILYRSSIPTTDRMSRFSTEKNAQRLNGFCSMED